MDISFVAAGLFYLAEIVEEYTVLTARIIKYMLIVSLQILELEPIHEMKFQPELVKRSCFFPFQGTTVIFIGLLLFEDLPLSMVLLGLVGNIAYFFVLQNFPYFEISSPSFLVSIGKCSVSTSQPDVLARFSNHGMVAGIVYFIFYHFHLHF